MAGPRWEKMWDLYHSATALPVDRRSEWLALACDDDELRQEVEELLAADGDRGLLDREPTLPTNLGDAQVLTERLVGQRLGPYRVLEEIGEGGMGVVYLAEQEHPVRRRVALKVVKLGMDTREVVARFESERQALALMDHPGIARVLDAGATVDGRPFFAMEHVAGQRIDDYCDVHRLELRQRVELLVAVCAAVQHAHRKGILHRDLKPSNVLVTTLEGEPVPKVIDFGVAKALHQRLTDRTLFTHVGSFIGTPDYMSPEQASSGGLEVDTRTDVYSLGVILHRLLAGLLPYDRVGGDLRDPAALARAVREREPVRPSQRFARLPPADALRVASDRRTTPEQLQRALRGDLDWIVLKALDRDPTRRYDSASELGADLRRALDDLPVAAGPPGAGYRLRKLARRHRAAVILATLALGSLIAVAVGATVQSRRIAAALREAEQERLRAETVSGFLEDLFTVPDPLEGTGRDTTALEVLDRGAARIRSALGDEAEVRTRLLEAMGRVYGNLGIYEQAATLQEEAVAFRRSRPTEAAALAGSLDDLGRTRFALGEYEAARALLVEALELRRRLGTALEMGSTLHHLAELLHDEGRYEAAEARYREALEIGRSAGEEGAELVADVLYDFAVLVRDRGRYEEAEALAREAVEVRQRLSGDDHPGTAAAREVLALVLVARGEQARAVPILRELVAAQERRLGESHPMLARALSTLGLALRGAGEAAEAEEVLRRALAIYRATQGDEHANTANATYNVAQAVLVQGRAPEAEVLYRDALRAWQLALGEEHPHLATGYHGLAAALEAQGELEEAEVAVRRALELDTTALDPGHPYLADDWQKLGRILRRKGELARSEEALAEALRIRRKAGDDPRRLSGSLLELAETVLASGRPEETLPLAREAVELRAGLEPADAVALAVARSTLGEALARSGDEGAGRALLVESHRVLAAELGPEAEETRHAAARLEAYGGPDREVESPTPTRPAALSPPG